MLKKLLAVLLSLAMVLSVGMLVFAEGEEPEESKEEEEEPFEWHAKDKYGPFGFSKSDRGLGEDDIIPEEMLDSNGVIMWDFGSWAPNCVFDENEGHTAPGCYKLPAGQSYRSFYCWSHINDVGTYKWTFWIKGKAGTEVWLDLEGKCGIDIEPYIIQTNDWELVEWEFTPYTPYTEGKDHGAPIRVYTNGHAEYEDYFVDDFTLECIEPKEPTIEVEDPPREYDPENGGLCYSVFQFKDTEWAWGSWSGGGTTYNTETGHMGVGCVQFNAGEAYRAFYFWSHIADSERYTISFWAKGTKGQTISFGNDAGKFEDQTYTFQSKKWEHVEFTFSVADPSDSPEGTGYGIRIYTTDATMDDFYIDEVVLMKAAEEPASSEQPGTDPADDSKTVTTDKPAEPDAKKSNTGLIIGIVAAVVVVAAVAAVLVANAKKKK